ncbi:SpaA isopeptide-forming pilin-related protein [Peptoniphilus sp. SGI.035]|uniref:SpaA isopeptide-forming pilin-related protein n=1 Tax=Peptoniphilus sp. SGI.035 TaxID=3420564 RepID=UPI003CFE6344
MKDRKQKIIIILLIIAILIPIFPDSIMALKAEKYSGVPLELDGEHSKKNKVIETDASQPKKKSESIFEENTSQPKKKSESIFEENTSQPKKKSESIFEENTSQPKKKSETIIETSPESLEILNGQRDSTSKNSPKDKAFKDKKDITLSEPKLNSASEELPKVGPESLPMADSLSPGQSKILSSPKTNYHNGERLDLKGIEILTKNADGQAKLYTLEELLSREDISINPKQGETIGASYYSKLKDPTYLSKESESVKKEIANYIEKHPLEDFKEPVNQITINIPGCEEIQIPLTIEEDQLHLSPLELFNALKLKNSSMMLLNIDKLTYRIGEEINLDSLKILLKDKDGNLSIITGSEILNNSNFKVDTLKFSSIQSLLIQKSKMEEKEGVLTQNKQDIEKILEGVRNDKKENIQNILASGIFKDLTTIVDSREPIQTSIKIEGENFGELYLPITIVNNDSLITPLDSKGDLNLLSWALNLDDQSIYVETLDVNSLADIKEAEIEFSESINKEKSNITIDRIVKTNGLDEEDISLRDIELRNIPEELRQKHLAGEDISQELPKFNINNPLSFSKNLEAGNKYVFFIKVKQKAKEETINKDIKAKDEIINKESNNKEIINKEINNKESNLKINNEIIENTNIGKDTIDSKLLVDIKVKVLDNDEIKEEVKNIIVNSGNSLLLPTVVLIPIIPPSEIRGDFLIKKVDSEDGKPLNGATFKLYDVNRKYESFHNISDRGETIVTRLLGLYILSELRAPEGYELSKKEWSIYVSSEGRAYIHEIGERHYGKSKGNDVTNNVLLTGAIDFTDYSANNKLDMGTEEEHIKIDMNIHVNGSVNPGDYFSIKESNTLHYNMTRPDYMDYPSIVDKEGRVLAYPTYGPSFNIEDGSGKEIVYVFTKDVAGRTNLDMEMTWKHSVNLNYVPNSGIYDFSVSVGEHDTISKKINVLYNKEPDKAPANDLNMDADYIYTNEQTGRYTLIAYINPMKKNITRDQYTVEICPEIEFNNNKLNVGDMLDVYPNGNVQDGRTRISVYKFKDKEPIPKAVIFDESKLEKVPYKVDLFMSEDAFDVYAKKVKFDNDPGATYLIKIDGDMKFPKEDPQKETILAHRFKVKAGPSLEFKQTYEVPVEYSDESAKEITKMPSITVENTKKTVTEAKGKLELIKKDENGAGLGRAVFKLESVDYNNLGSSRISPKDGKILFDNISPGLYELREEYAPAGYELSNKKWSVYVNSEGKTFIQEIGDIGTLRNDQNDVTSRVIFSGDLSFNDISGNRKLDVGTEENNIAINMHMVINDSVNPGDYFTIKESDTLHYNMLQPDKMNYPSIVDKEGRILAYPTYGVNFNIRNGSGKEISYVFTDNVVGMKNLEMDVTWNHSVNQNFVRHSWEEEYYVSLGNQKITKNFVVLYKNPQEEESRNLNIDTNYLYTNDQSGRYTQIAYINPLKKDIRGECNINIYPASTKLNFNMADIKDGKTKIKLYKFIDQRYWIPDAVIFEESKLDLVDPSEYTLSFITEKKDGEDVNLAQVKLNNIGTSTYLIKVESEMKFPEENSGERTTLDQWIELTNGGAGVKRANSIALNYSKASGSGTISDEIPSITVTNIKKKAVNLLIYKKNVQGNLLDAEFKLTGTSTDGDEYESNGTRDKDGILMFVDLKPGEYTLTETLGPVGYERFDGYWKIVVTEDCKVTATPSKKEKKVDYKIQNFKGKRIYEYISGYYYSLMDVQALLSQNSGGDSLNLKILYKGQDLYGNISYPIEIVFDTKNFTILDHDGNTVNGEYMNQLLSGSGNPSGEINFTVKWKDLSKTYPRSPIEELTYKNIKLEESTYPTASPIKYEVTGETKDLRTIGSGGNTFYYEITNKEKLYEAEFLKVGRNNPDDSSQDIPLANVEFKLYKKDSEGNFVDYGIRAISEKDGSIKIKGLGVGEYELHEVYIPDGYEPKKGSVKAFKIAWNGNVEIKDADDNYHPINDENKKIINYKSGTEKITIYKKGPQGEKLKDVVFQLIGSNGTVVNTGTTNEDGKVVFENLQYGKYWLREFKTVKGYVLDPNPIPVFLGKDWEAPRYPENPKNWDDYISIKQSENNDIVSTSGKNTVYPNKAEGLVARINCVINKPRNAPNINPGDTFTLRLSQNLDLDGTTVKVEDKDFDIMTPSGKLAVAKIAEDRRSIEYTFTDYVKYHEVSEFNINIPVFINRELILNNENDVEFSLEIGREKFSKNLNVSYENYVSDPNRVKTYVTKFDDKTGKFTAIIYVNPQGDYDYNRIVDFRIDGLRRWEIKMFSATAGVENLPWSYGVDYRKLNRLPVNFNLIDGKILRFYLGNELSNNAYVIKIDGQAEINGREITTNTQYNRTTYISEDIYGQSFYENRCSYWQTYIKYYKPESTAQGEVVFNLKNEKNKIEFIKIEGKSADNIPKNENPSGDSAAGSHQNKLPIYLEGATFRLKKKDGNVWSYYNDVVKSDSQGRFSWEGLPQGEYQVWEIEAPKGYITPKTFVSSFKVDNKGNIVNILNDNIAIPNETNMFFYLNKIWKDDEAQERSITKGTLELTLKAPEGKVFPDGVKVDEKNAQINDRKYKIKSISDDRKSITLEIDLENAYEKIIGSQDDKNKGIKIIVPDDWPSGNYTLTESKAPAGYKKGTEDYNITINQEEKSIKSGNNILYSKNGQVMTLNSLKIVNEKGLFPKTGGIGSLIFTIAGVTIMAAAFIGYRRKKVIK